MTIDTIIRMGPVIPLSLSKISIMPSRWLMRWQMAGLTSLKSRYAVQPRSIALQRLQTRGRK